ncbi:MAG: DNA polymerase III subunit delta' [Alphaproteobacteria bacterium]|nr:DNA polymerase III subunit delta' [Alphaproteobacteria bacterium]
MGTDTNILPQNNSFLIGQLEAEAVFLRAWKNDSLHHAWILSGPMGVGKATLAYRIARFLLWADENKKEQYSSLDVPENSDIFQQIACGSYPDLMVLERDYIETDRKKIISAIRKGEAMSEDELAGLKKSAYIRVDDVRKVTEFLSKTSFNDNWRIIILDSADDMNRSASNALLKILEEPPSKTILLLISHNPSLLLPTIRSRCAKLPLHVLQNNEVASLLRRYRPELDEQDVNALSNISEGSIGKALIYADTNAVSIYERLCGLLYAKRNMSILKLSDFCTEMAKDAQKFDILQELIVKLLKENMCSCADKEELYACFNETRQMFADCTSVNMDKKMMLITLLTEISKAL